MDVVTDIGVLRVGEQVFTPAELIIAGTSGTSVVYTTSRGLWRSKRCGKYPAHRKKRHTVFRNGNFSEPSTGGGAPATPVPFSFRIAI